MKVHYLDMYHLFLFNSPIRNQDSKEKRTANHSCVAKVKGNLIEGPGGKGFN